MTPPPPPTKKPGVGVLGLIVSASWTCDNNGNDEMGMEAEIKHGLCQEAHRETTVD